VSMHMQTREDVRLLQVHPLVTEVLELIAEVSEGA